MLVVIDGLRSGGAENLLVTMARSASACGVSLDVVGLAGVDEQRSVAADLRAAGCRVHVLGTRRLLDVPGVLRLVRLLRSREYDVVHTHLEYSAVVGTLAARLAGVPVVCSFHHVPDAAPLRTRAKGWLAVRVADLSDGVLTVSRAQLAAFERRYAIRRTRWRVVNNGIQLDRFVAAAGSPLPTDLRSRCPAGPSVALVARLSPGKGQRAAIDAWPAVLERLGAVHLFVVGDGALRAALEDRVDDLGLRDQVTFTGLRRDVPAIVAGVDLVVLPSDMEALPTTLIEAAAARTCVVATSVGGVGEVVVDGVTGVLVAPGDAEAFVAAVTGLLLDDGRRARLARAAQERALARFDARPWVERLVSVYEEVQRTHQRVTG